jgi:peptide deformylase
MEEIRIHPNPKIDHLNGILIIHCISRLKRELLMKRILKKLRDS